MNKVILMGRLTRDPNVRYTQQNSSQESMCVARYTLAVDRRGARDGQQSADFISCVAFGKNGEFAEKYFKQGTKIAITGRIQTGSYTNRDGQKMEILELMFDVTMQEMTELIPNFDQYSLTSRQKLLAFISVKELYDNRDKYRSDTKLLASAASSMLLKEIYGGAAQ